MSLQTPTTKQISDNIIAQLSSSLNQAIPLLPKSFLRVLSKARAALIILLYKYGGFIFLRLFVRTASNSPTEIQGRIFTPLAEWAVLRGVDPQESATQAELLIDVTVENQVGALNSGAQLTSTTNGVTYITIGSVLLNAPIVQATVRAVADQSGGDGSGAIGNLEVGAQLSFANSLENVNRVTTVTAQIITGANGETEEAFRQRVLNRFQKPPQGGAYADYQEWAESVPGIVNAYPYTSTCPGQVDVYIEATPESSGSPDGIPTTAQLQEALDAIFLDENGLNSRRPATALANTFPITRAAFDVRVLGIAQVDDIASVQADITTGVTEYFLNRDLFIEGLSIPPRRDRVTNSAVTGVVEDIVNAAGGIFNSVIVTLNTNTIDIYSLQIGEKAKLGTLTFV
jgi:uncharacterized phage protein gp47/JayE